MNSRLDALSHEAEQLAAQEDSPAYAWDSVAREWTDLEAKSNGLDDAVRQRFAAAETVVRERAEAKRAAAEKALRQHVQRLDQLIERATKRATRGRPHASRGRQGGARSPRRAREPAGAAARASATPSSNG